MVGASLRSVKAWEAGDAVPRPFYRRRLAKVLGVSVAELGFWTCAVSSTGRSRISPCQDLRPTAWSQGDWRIARSASGSISRSVRATTLNLGKPLATKGLPPDIGVEIAGGEHPRLHHHLDPWESDPAYSLYDSTVAQIGAPSGTITIQRLGPEQEGPLRDALYEAAYWRGDDGLAVADALATPHLRVYIEGWGRPGDVAVGARDSLGIVGGAAWFRLFTQADHGYGFVRDGVPEVGIGVQPGWRRRGVGRSLLLRLHTEARALGITQLSLSVERDNPALRLYESLGYVCSSDAGGAATMVLDLDARWSSSTTAMVQATDTFVQPVESRRF
jgi:GNAT superfamily N-acetyltransferase